MKENTSIEIMPAANGFIVRPARDRYESTTTDDVLVCQTMAELLFLLQDHFSHRCAGVLLDAEMPPKRTN